MPSFAADQPQLIPVPEDDLSRAAWRKIERLAAMREHAAPEDQERLWLAERKIWADEMKRRMRVHWRLP